jgi:hypothetical protein
MRRPVGRQQQGCPPIVDGIGIRQWWQERSGARGPVCVMVIDAYLRSMEVIDERNESRTWDIDEFLSAYEPTERLGDLR